MVTEADLAERFPGALDADRADIFRFLLVLEVDLLAVEAMADGTNGLESRRPTPGVTAGHPGLAVKQRRPLCLHYGRPKAGVTRRRSPLLAGDCLALQRPRRGVINGSHQNYRRTPRRAH